jgi:predicted SAM-dependent methyltransferase
MIKFNVGCGKRNWPGWVNVDGADLPHIHDHDITLKYQPNDYIDLLYSSHLIAYFDREEADELLAGWYKKIKPGGVLRLATPNFSKLMYIYNSFGAYSQIEGPLYGRMEMNGQFIYHKTCYTDGYLRELLKYVGFRNVHRYDHRETEHPNTGNREDLYDDHSAAYIGDILISLNMQATK